MVGAAELPVRTAVPLEHLQADTPMKVVTDVRGGEGWVTAIELERACEGASEGP
jgi:hypothetical protein